MQIKRSFLAIFLMLLFVSAGCASSRGVSVGSEASNYAVDVTNRTGSAVDVFWSTGDQPKMLGNVGPGRKEHFIIAGSKSATVSITAQNSGGKSFGPYAVTLQAGGTRAVTIQ